MARALLNSAYVALIKRRGYSTVGAVTESGNKARTVDSNSSSNSSLPPSPPSAAYSGSSSWVPDPVTGNYRPTNPRGETDDAVVRESLRSNHK